MCGTLLQYAHTAVSARETPRQRGGAIYLSRHSFFTSVGHENRLAIVRSKFLRNKATDLCYGTSVRGYGVSVYPCWPSGYGSSLWEKTVKNLGPSGMRGYTKQSQRHCKYGTTGSSYKSLLAAQTACNSTQACRGVYDSACDGKKVYMCKGSLNAYDSSSCVYKRGAKPTHPVWRQWTRANGRDASVSYGGAIYVGSGILWIAKSVFHQNEASLGAAIYLVRNYVTNEASTQLNPCDKQWCAAALSIFRRWPTASLVRATVTPRHCVSRSQFRNARVKRISGRV